MKTRHTCLFNKCIIESHTDNGKCVSWLLANRPKIKIIQHNVEKEHNFQINYNGNKDVAGKYIYIKQLK